MMRDGRYAALDIGTVTCRMLIADVVDGRIIEQAKEYAITNLGEGVDATGYLKPEAMQRVAQAIDGYLQVRARFDTAEQPVLCTTVVATSASRDAKNAADFVALLQERGLDLAVIPGTKEAALSFMGASSGFPGEQIMVVDIGGGSTEVVYGKAGETPLRSHSFDIGCRRVTERFLHENPYDPAELDAARAWVREGMSSYFEEIRESGFSLDRLVAVAGTATSVVSMRDRMEVYDSSRVHKAEVSREELQQVRAHAAALTLEQRREIVGLDPRRAPVITAGLVILEEVLDLAHASGFTASESDILHGIVLDTAQSW